MSDGAIGYERLSRASTSGKTWSPAKPLAPFTPMGRYVQLIAQGDYEKAHLTARP